VGNSLPECGGAPRLGPRGGGVEEELGLCCGSISVGFFRFRLAWDLGEAELCKNRCGEMSEKGPVVGASETGLGEWIRFVFPFLLFLFYFTLNIFTAV
jgi:hypothetical protein